jgi:protein-S-isoprenylcysteine O-methyltransferase Ste14
VSSKNKKWFLMQAAFLLSILFVPFKISMHLPNVIRYLGISFMVIGIGLASYAVISLGSNLKPSLSPRIGGFLITTGLYGIVRHPAYSGVAIAALGYSFWMNDAVRVVLTGALCILFDYKSKIEEEWLEKTYPEYTSYKKRVTNKFIPWVY